MHVGLVVEAQTDVSEVAWHIEGRRQVIYGMNYGMAAKSVLWYSN